MRASQGGWVYHVLDRANARQPIFDKPVDYDAFERILAEGVERYYIRLLVYCLLPNHWHLLVWPKADGDLSRLMARVTLTHTQRWHAHRDSAGTGHVYQGRFKSFPVQDDDHFYTLRGPGPAIWTAVTCRRFPILWQSHFPSFVEHARQKRLRRIGKL